MTENDLKWVDSKDSHFLLESVDIQQNSYQENSSSLLNRSRVNPCLVPKRDERKPVQTRNPSQSLPTKCIRRVASRPDLVSRPNQKSPLPPHIPHNVLQKRHTGIRHRPSLRTLTSIAQANAALHENQPVIPTLTNVHSTSLPQKRYQLSSFDKMGLSHFNSYESLPKSTSSPSQSNLTSISGPNRPSTFFHMHKLIEMEIKFVKKPLFKKNRLYMFHDSAHDTTDSPVVWILLSDTLIFVWILDGSSDSNSSVPKDEITIPLDSKFTLEPVQKNGVLITAPSSNHSLTLCFRSESQLESFMNKVYAASDAYKAYKIRLSQKRKKKNQVQEKQEDQSGKSHTRKEEAMTFTLNTERVNPDSSMGVDFTIGELASMKLDADFAHRSTRTKNTLKKKVSEASLTKALVNEDYFAVLRRRRAPSITSINSETSSLASIWVPDSEALVCMVCETTQFGIITRKHHCRQCGRVICHKCSTFRPFTLLDQGSMSSISSSVSLTLLPTNSNGNPKPIRICVQCHEVDDEYILEEDTRALFDQVDTAESLYTCTVE